MTSASARRWGLVLLLVGFAPPTEAAEPARAEPNTVLLLGDSNFFGNLGHKLKDRFDSLGFRVHLVAKPGSGLSHPGFWDWLAKARSLIAEHRPLVTVMIFGGNDGQSLKPRPGATDRTRIPFEDVEAWDREYTARVRDLSRTVVGTGSHLVLLSPPNRRSLTERAKMRRVMALQQGGMANIEGARWVSTWDLTSDVDGRVLMQALNAQGAFVRFRRTDGIHFTPEGAEALTHRLVPRLLATGLFSWPYRRQPVSAGSLDDFDP